ncbi:MAG TPA: GIY-YIG nuclease family protein [Candidatus Babeliales bacterium]|nr:GIY-YIG nuclease family protein [Candidatus Babeliales bacterium]
MYYVYLLRSIQDPSKKYIGYTTDIEQRIAAHNSGGSVHTQKYRPWQLITYIAFDCEKKALEFEKYIKVGSGNAFAKKRLW